MSEDVRLMLWDTAGQEEFDAITKAYYRGAQACVIAFSTTDRSSFDAVKKWKRKVEDECGHVPMVLVQNKIDLLHEAQVSPEDVERLAKELQVRLYRTSVKEDLNVGNVFQHLAENYVSKVKAYSNEVSPAGFNSTNGNGVVSDPFSDPFQAMQIGVGTRPFVTPTTQNNAVTANGYRNRQQAKKSQQKKNTNNFMYSNGNSNHRSSNSTNFFGSHSYRPSSGYYGHTYRNGPAAAAAAGYPAAAGGFSPQDYLNNPMFDSLHSHRRYWPMDRTITLRPLNGFAKKNVHKKIPLHRNGCKVL